ncbi:hypothetical protein N802_04940 [Knoellia sinensis KCTC 19936]|uniref:DUF58 domain-containing protein n=1 Tax=Knoellia sinensis KCTC 19936 TaxID=1385520 RepID=A0A0A0J515_9MICO|nr:DUF58 domain-containing protein [Knoellia sinensis]KGN31177.1 hypothetical protein N802_04940 [Knoellia sinensis KCTC 19936]
MTKPVESEESTVRRSDLSGPPPSTPQAPPRQPLHPDPVDAESTISRSSLKVRPAQDQPSRRRSNGATASGGSRWRSVLGLGSRAEDTQAIRRNDTQPAAVSGKSTRRRAELPTITLPRVQIPTALTETGARILDLTGDRIKPLAERSEPVWRPVTRGLAWVSPLGWTVLALGLVAWFLASRYEWTELAMIAVACLVLFLACVALAVGHAKVEIRTDVDPTRVVVGEPATGRIEVRNLSGRGMLPLLVELPVGRSAARFTLPSLASGKTHEELFVVPTERRGVIKVGPATTVHGDPLGLVRRTMEWTEQTELFVHPETTSLESLGAGLLRDLEGEVTPDLSMSDLAFHALREYQPGDDRRYIHWRSSAKHGRLLVRQFLDTRRSHLAVVVDTTPEVYTGEDAAVELAISCAASLAVRSILDEQDTTVVCHDQQISRSTAPITLDAFARAEVGPVDVFGSTGDAAALAPDASIAILVTGSHRPFIQVQRALAQFEVEVIKVALVIDPDAQVGVRSAAGLTILTVRELADLRRVLFSGALV